MVKVTFAGGRVCPSASLQVIQPHLHAVIDDRYHTGTGAGAGSGWWSSPTSTHFVRLRQI